MPNVQLNLYKQNGSAMWNDRNHNPKNDGLLLLLKQMQITNEWREKNSKIAQKCA